MHLQLTQNFRGELPFPGMWHLKDKKMPYLCSFLYPVLLFLVSPVSQNKIQSALVISNFKGLSEIHRDTRTSTYQISRIEKKI